MIAGGTGITPMLQVVRAIIRGRPHNGGTDTTEVDLIFANVNEEDILLREDLDALAAKDKKFRVHYVLNNPPQNWNGGVGFVTTDIIKVCFLKTEKEIIQTRADQLKGQLPGTCKRYKNSHLRASTDGQRNEKSHRIARV